MDFALFVAPALILLSLLLSGRYVGAERIVARHRPAAGRRRVAQRWRLARARQLVSLLDRGAAASRGPPAPVAG
jgi:hypothetical protein